MIPRLFLVVCALALLSSAKLKGGGGKYQVCYSVDGSAPKLLDKWEPIWVDGWVSGKHSIKLELVDQRAIW